MKKGFLLTLCMLCIGLLSAQDIHFSQFYMSPLTLNPAMTANMDGTYRFGAIYRSQWSSVGAPYKTVGASAETQLFRRAMGGNNYFGVGINLFNDVSGDGNLTNFTGSASLSYTQALDPDGNFHLTGGVQGAYSQEQITFSNLYFADQFSIDQFSPSITSADLKLSKPTFSFLDLNAGLALSGFFSDKFRATIGFAVFNLNTPTETFYSDGNSKLPARYVAHATGTVVLNHKLLLFPTLLYMQQASNEEITIGTSLGFNLSPNRYRIGNIFYIGEQLRFGDAAITTIGMIMKTGLQAGLSYDVNVSSLTAASAYKGGFEVAVTYTGFAYQPKKPRHINCPRF